MPNTCVGLMSYNLRDDFITKYRLIMLLYEKKIGRSLLVKLGLPHNVALKCTQGNGGRAKGRHYLHREVPQELLDMITEFNVLLALEEGKDIRWGFKKKGAQKPDEIGVYP